MCVCVCRVRQSTVWHVKWITLRFIVTFNAIPTFLAFTFAFSASFPFLLFFLSPITHCVWMLFYWRVLVKSDEKRRRRKKKNLGWNMVLWMYLGRMIAYRWRCLWPDSMLMFAHKIFSLASSAVILNSADRLVWCSHFSVAASSLCEPKRE